MVTCHCKFKKDVLPCRYFCRIFAHIQLDIGTVLWYNELDIGTGDWCKIFCDGYFSVFLGHYPLTLS